MELQAEFESQVTKIIASAVPGKFKKIKITRETNLQKDLGLDSIGMLALVFRFEELFGVDIAQLGMEIDIAKLKTVNDLINAGQEIMRKALMAKAN